MTTRPRGLRRILAAALVVTLGVGAGVSALAQERGEHGRGGRGYERGFERGYGRGGAAAPYGRGGYEGPVYAPAPYSRGQGPRSPYADGPPRPYPYVGEPGRLRAGDGAPRYAPPYGGPRAGYSGFRRGQILPPGFAGDVVADPRAYRLRRPPAGYGWVLSGPNAYLVQRSTGMILDIAPLY